jgi:hypothetical protein
MGVRVLPFVVRFTSLIAIARFARYIPAPSRAHSSFRMGSPATLSERGLDGSASLPARLLRRVELLPR